MIRATVRATALLLGCAAGAFVAVTGCATGIEVAATATGDVSDLPVNAEAADACGRFFALDIRVRQMSLEGAAQSNSGELPVSVHDYRDGVLEFVEAAGTAVRSGGLPNEVLTHASRILGLIGDVGDGTDGPTSIPGGRVAAILSYERSIEVICVAARVTVPQANLDARLDGSGN